MKNSLCSSTMLLLPVLATAMLFAGPSIAAQGDSLIGYSGGRDQQQLEREQRFDSLLDPAVLRERMQTMTIAPHNAGAPQTEKNARFMVELFRQWGYDAEIETFHVLFPTPKIRELELLEPVRFKADLMEKVLPGDSTSKVAIEQGLPPFNAYSADGDVTAELVYVNQGVPRDYDVLERLGISVEGKIVIARYGGSWRGIKPKLAHEKGAIGCIIYNDPRDDGYHAGETYPDGPYKHDHGVQRGSVLDLPLRPGDPLTPMRGATEDARRLERENADNIMKIPVLPISWPDAKPLLEALEGPVAPGSWRGGLPITYRIGPGPAKVRLHLEFNWDLVPAHNVIARLEGSERPDEWIMRGNHHDAWVIGANDPISGIVALMAEAEAIGQLVKEGWRPKRSILYGAWDAEEPGAARLHRVGRAPRRRAAAQAGGLHQQRLERPRLPLRRRLARAREAGRRGRTRRRRPADRHQRRRALALAPAGQRRRQRQLSRETVARCASRRSALAATTRPSCSTSASPRSTSASAARTAAASTTPLSTPSTTIASTRTRLSSTASRSPRSPVV